MRDSQTAGSPPERRTPRLQLAAAPALVVVVLLAGLWLVGGELASLVARAVGHGFWVSIAAGVVWFLVAARLMGLLTRGRGALRITVRATYLVTAIVVTAVALYTSLRTTTVNETVAVGVPASKMTTSDTSSAVAQPSAPPAAPVNIELASGTFRSIDESASGHAAIVRLASGGRVLTLTDFSSSNGPDVRVYLVAGSVQRTADIHDFRDLGGLKGNRGNQQYTIDDDVDIRRYATAVIYCRGFSVAFGAAALQPS